jgi:ankyrin repeat protein
MPKPSTATSCGFLLFLLLAVSPIPAATPPGLIAAIRSGDDPEVESLLRSPAEVNARDEHGNTPLHWAALANDERLVKQLLAAGADVHATNRAGATPLHYGTGDDRIVRDLLRAGADPNARSLNGAAPLHTAAARPDAHRVVKRLLAAGAGANDPRSLFPAGVNVPVSDPAFLVVSPLALAVYYGDPRSATLLLEHGASAGGTNGFTPVAAAAFTGRGDWVRELVKRGGAVNFDEGFVGHALNNLLYAGHRQFVPFLIEHGADLHQTTSIGERTPPMVWSAYTETADLGVAKALLAAGLNVNEPTGAGHTALDWAMKRGETPLVAFLRSQGATNSPPGTRPKDPPQNPVPADPAGRSAMLRDSVQRAIAILQRGSDGFLANGFVKESGCVSCHHETLPAIAFGRARERGFQLDEGSLARQLHTQYASWSKGRDAAYEMFEPQPDSPANLGYGLFGLKSLGYAPDDLTEAMVWFLAASQLPDGSFPGFDRRPPLEEGQMIGTAFAVGALRLYPQPLKAVDLKRTFARARGWLLKFEPQDPNQRLHRLLGLGWAGAPPDELRTPIREVLSAQRADGGWAGFPAIPSDAFATGLTLFVLHEVGGLGVNEEPYRRGVEFLLRTQFEDGSWRVPSRTWPLQPHFDSGFPHGRDQWISSAGTAWATIALLNEIEPVAPRESLPTAQVLMAKYPVAPDDLPKAEPASAPVAGTAKADDSVFARDILPILQKSCVNCHGGDKPRGDFSLATVAGLLKGGQSKEPAIIPGKPDASPLIRFVTDQVEDLEMPPMSKRSKYPALTSEEIGRIKEWIAAGAK